MMTPIISLLIVTSLYEVFVERMGYDDIFHTSACDLIRSTNTSYSEVTMSRDMIGVIILNHLNKYFIQ
jgi:hypothetical protein